MAKLTIDTDQLIQRAVELEGEKQAILGDIASHREDLRRTARLVNDPKFTEFVDNFFPTKQRGQTRTPEQVKEAREYKVNLLKQYGIEVTNGEGDDES